MVTHTTHIAYLFFDPLCGWCYGASAILEKLAALPDFSFALAPTGHFAGSGARPMDNGFAAFAWANDQRISRLSGQPFSEAYRRNVLGDHTRPFDSGPATLAITAVALHCPGPGVRCSQGHSECTLCRGPRQHGHLGSLACAARVAVAGDRGSPGPPDDALIAANRTRLDTARVEMRRFGANGVPSLIVGNGESRRLVSASSLFGSMETLVEGTEGSPEFY